MAPVPDCGIPLVQGPDPVFSVASLGIDKTAFLRADAGTPRATSPASSTSSGTPSSK
jgi:hypothetical protein